MLQSNSAEMVSVKMLVYLESTARFSLFGRQRLLKRGKYIALNMHYRTVRLHDGANLFHLRRTSAAGKIKCVILKVYRDMRFRQERKRSDVPEADNQEKSVGMYGLRKLEEGWVRQFVAKEQKNAGVVERSGIVGLNPVGAVPMKL